MQNKTGSVTWFDLTVTNAKEVSDFYSRVVGWKSSPVPINGYDDFNMQQPEDGETVAGICHSRGGNANIPPQWMIYITVEDVHKSAEICQAEGGKVLVGPKKMAGYGEYCIIEDPAGAVAALFTPVPENMEESERKGV